MITQINLMSLRFLLIILLSALALSCRERGDKSISGYQPGKDEMLNVNRFIIQKDRERIQSYIERKGLTMNESQTGLWYCLIKEGEGDLFKENDRIVYEYECSLLDGTNCYSSEELGPREIYLGSSELPAGLNEGFKLLKPGADAIFILPPFLAYGLIGDGKQIPPRSIVVFNIHVVN